LYNKKLISQNVLQVLFSLYLFEVMQTSLNLCMFWLKQYLS